MPKHQNQQTTVARFVHGPLGGRDELFEFARCEVLAVVHILVNLACRVTGKVKSRPLLALPSTPSRHNPAVLPGGI